MKEIKIKCDHCDKDITCNERFDLNTHISKVSSVKDYALGVLPYMSGENKEIQLCPSCFKLLEQIIKDFLN